ncbi:MAG: ADP-ribosylation factor-like protein [Promethearchaeia archaeon]
MRSSKHFLCISYFDQIIGPNIFYCNERIEEKNDKDFPNLTRIMEFNEEDGSFIFAFRKYQTINRIFNINSRFARGGKEVLMISYLVKSSYFRNEITDVFKYLQLKKPLLRKFSKELSQIEELPKVLASEKSGHIDGNLIQLGSKEFQEKFLAIFNKYYEKIIPRIPYHLPTTSRGTSKKKIFIFGSEKSGKKTFLKNIEVIQFHKQKNRDLPTLIYEIVIDNIEVMTFHCTNKELECEECSHFGNCINDAQGFVLIFDASDKKSLIEAKKKYQVIVNKCQLYEKNIQDTPVLIIGNKFTYHEEVPEEMVEEVFNFEPARVCDIVFKYFPINIMKEDEKLMRSLRWLVQHML